MKPENALPPEWLAAQLHSPDTPHESLPVGGFRPARDRWQPRPAAVLVPIIHWPEPAIVLTVRSRKLSLHAGQVALPGGGRASAESFPLGTALRETHEEIGVAPELVAVHGLLDCYDTITGYRIVPVVASIDSDCRLRACPDEVDEIFTLPLSLALDPGQYRHHRVVRGGHAHDLVSMPHPRWLIWGATAAILHQLCQKLS